VEGSQNLMLSYLQTVVIWTYQWRCIRLVIFPTNHHMLIHEKSVMQLGQFLLDTCKRGLIYTPNKIKCLSCCVYMHFSSAGWSQADAYNAENVLLCTGYVHVIMFTNCPIHWVSQLQTEIALSNAEAKYIALSQALATSYF
jgi:hypothetical protein